MPDAERQERLRSYAGAVLGGTLLAYTIGWCWAVAAGSSLELLPFLSREGLIRRFAVSGALGMAALAVTRKGALLGLCAGLVMALLGAQALVFMRVLRAWRVHGDFAGVFFAPLVPLALAACAVLCARAILSPRLGVRRWPVILAVLLLWAVPSRALWWKLSSRWGLKDIRLEQEARLTPPSSAQRLVVARLYPSGGRDYRFEQAIAEVAGVDVSPENLHRLEKHLKAKDFDSVFVTQALSALRQGWLFWWEPDRALEAAMWRRPGRFPPDYKAALGLLRAGAVTEERYRSLQSLADAAAPRDEGFEDVNTSQLIFEGFASAFARFGDEEPARQWLFRVDDLWPIYDKKIEVSPLETVHDGAVAGEVRLDGRPGRELKVGLFFVASSSSTESLSGLLSQSAFPDARGSFRFEALAPGTYYIGLMGRPADLSGRILNPPGLFDLTPETPAIVLDPIRVERQSPVTYP